MAYRGSKTTKEFLNHISRIEINQKHEVTAVHKSKTTLVIINVRRPPSS